MFKGIDFFSDTATQPTAAMKQAMVEAELGDEQKAEDPTTNKLQKMTAAILGQESALFFPSATMANEVALRLLCEPGDELIAAENCHLFLAEVGGPAVHAGIMARPISTSNGLFTAEDVRSKYRAIKGVHYPITRCLSLENTTNIGGGIAWPMAQLNEVLSLAQELDLKTHLDGARLFNAAVKLNVAPSEIANRFDTVTICFSKGLGCAAGAILAFKQKHYDKVRRLKQLMGGALRQSGMLAAAAIYALQNHVDRLTEDHQDATLFAEKLAQEIPELTVETNPPSTNMVFFHWRGTCMTAEQFNQKCIEQGLRFSYFGAGRFRAVTHLGITQDDVEKTITILKNISR